LKEVHALHELCDCNGRWFIIEIDGNDTHLKTYVVGYLMALLAVTVKFIASQIGFVITVLLVDFTLVLVVLLRHYFPF